MIKSKNAEKEQNNKKKLKEAKNNLSGFFDLLLKIDKRINPHLYKNKNDGIQPRKSIRKVDIP